MKKVIESEEVTPLSSVNEDKYYGVINTSNREVVKGFIGRREYEYGEFCVFCSDKLTMGNTWPDYDSKNLTKLISDLINSKNFTVYEFDTSVELFKWLGE